jgi:hypothetical protein
MRGLHLYDKSLAKGGGGVWRRGQNFTHTSFFCLVVHGSELYRCYSAARQKRRGGREVSRPYLVGYSLLSEVTIFDITYTAIGGARVPDSLEELMCEFTYLFILRGMIIPSM